MGDVVYILTNEAMPGLIKIGYTGIDLASRIKQLYSTPGVPLPFELFYACEVNDGLSVESKLHDAFGDHRISKSREFFRLAPERAKAALSLAAIKEVKLGDEIFENNEMKAEVEAAKRRSRFRLSMLGILPGTQLQLAKDPKIICTTVDETNKVEYLGDVTSLSDAALQAHNAVGDDWPSVSGPWAWTYQGKRLDDLRTEIEEKSD
ncbi:GIY-YIG nuclease family protein [Bradyrhizobium diazoefficiens]